MPQQDSQGEGLSTTHLLVVWPVVAGVDAQANGHATQDISDLAPHTALMLEF
jgi:hypothetical protein